MQKTESVEATTPKTVDVNGQQALLLAANLNADSKLAVIHLSVLERLIGLLSTETVRQMKNRICDKVMAAGTHEEVVGVMRDELEFQLSVNMITTYIDGSKPQPVHDDTHGGPKAVTEK